MLRYWVNIVLRIVLNKKDTKRTLPASYRAPQNYVHQLQYSNVSTSIYTLSTRTTFSDRVSLNAFQNGGKPLLRYKLFKPPPTRYKAQKNLIIDICTYNDRQNKNYKSEWLI